MPVEYAIKYAKEIDEKFAAEPSTAALVSRNYDWNGTKTIKVYSIGVPTINDYQLTGLNRYGSPEELNATTAEYTLTQDKAFTFTIDKRNALDTNGALNAGVALNRTMREAIYPMVDKYRYAKMVAGAGTTKTNALTKANIYESILDAQEALGNASAPSTGKVLVITMEAYKLLKQDPAFVRAGDLAQDMLIKGSFGMVDGMNVLAIPKDMLPANVAFLVMHPIAVIGAEKIIEFDIFDKVPGVSGNLVQGRIYFDAFVLANKKKAIYVHKTAA